MLRLRITAAVAFAVAAPSIVSCTAILAPRDDVQRCGSADDCKPTQDNRYIAVCKFDDANTDLDTSEVSKVCVADFKPDVGCDPDAYQEMTYGLAHDSLAVASRYAGEMGMTCADLGGVLGCPPDQATGTCAEGLTRNDETGLCDDGSGLVYNATSNADLLGQDVKDQFCRSFFCDDRFVCNENNRCAMCDPDAPVGQGGCGEIYISGTPSCVYQDQTALDSTCAGSDAATDDVMFGC